MSNPTLARKDDLGRRFYTFGDPPESFWSVTTIISGGVPKHLQAHYAKMAAELAFDEIAEGGPHSRATAILRRLARRGRADFVGRQERGELTSLKIGKQSDRDLALRWLKGAADRHRDAAGERGSAVHAEAEALVLEHARESARLYVDHAALTPWPPELAGYERAFLAWLDHWHPEFLATEFTVFNRTESYAGTGDTIVRVTLDGRPLVVITDYKGGREIYPEVGLQLAPYARGEFIGHPDGMTEIPMIPVDAGAVLHLRADGRYRFVLVRIDDVMFDVFRFAREVYRFTEQLAGTVFLQDLTPLQAPAEVA